MSYRRYRDAHLPRYNKLAVTPWGFELYGDAYLAESREESGEAGTFMRLADEADLVVDVGAHVGLFTLLARSRGVPVVAIEPSPMNLAKLYRNLRSNEAEDVEVMPVALGDHVGLSHLYGGGQGASLRKGWGSIGSTYTTRVPLHTLDSLLYARTAGQRLLIKIDSEGSELPILRGAEGLLRNDPAPSWIVEIGLKENFGGQVNPDFREIFETFWRLEYTATCVEAAGRPVSESDIDIWVLQGDLGVRNINYLFEKRPA